MSQQRFFCLMKVAKFNINRTLMTVFYKAYTESILTFSLICWFASLKEQKTNKQTKNALAKSCKQL